MALQGGHSPAVPSDLRTTRSLVCGLWSSVSAAMGSRAPIRMDAAPQPPGRRERCCWAGWEGEGRNTTASGASLGFSFRGLALSAEPCDKALAVTVHWHLRLVLAWGSSWVLAAIQLLATSGSGALALLSTGLWPPGRANRC